MPSYKLRYFDIRGIGEVSRQIFFLSGTPFGDERIQFEDWDRNSRIKKGTPFGTLPVLEIDGEVIPTSCTINRYLAKQFGFAGKSPFQGALVDALADQFMDYFEEVKKFLLISNGIWEGEVDEAIRQRAERGVANHFPLIEEFVKVHGSDGYCVGGSLTWVDLLLTDHFRSLIHYFPDVLSPFPVLTHVVETIGSDPRLSEWRKEHESIF
ncbi:hypothetical protein PMAYCL1PPCAC_17264 [Pristionchus mayeri]|uniref:glutathione transferase n=1 Tax=Pristionchus mayeri TaxID=1317129 RepID=A0AAN5I075_9BILA|nr:hypothetical protein PMAYCL1PPCAC_17264 [Pristionchus mayeri]